MNFVFLFILCSVALSEADDFLCQSSYGNTLEYYCETFTGTVPENCSKENALRTPSNVKHLKIGGCDARTIAYALAVCPNLLSLDISHSNYSSLDFINFGHSTIRKINVSHNKLSEISLEFVSRFPQATVLDYSHNKINLSDKKLTEKEFKTFGHLTNVQHLDLSNNEIRWFESYVFTNLSNLKKLNLKNNPIDLVIENQFFCDYLFGTKSISIYISWENVRVLNTDCQKAQFHAIVNDKQERIRLKPEFLHEIHCKEESFRNIYHFDARDNKFDNVLELMRCLTASIEAIDLSGNAVGCLHEGIFEKFINLKWLYLENTNLSDFDFSVLRNQKQLRLLHLSENSLRRLENVSILRTFEHLETLSVEGNSIENMSEMIQNLPLSMKMSDYSLIV